MKILVDDLHQMKHTVNSDPIDIWETLNKRYHNKFGFGETLKEQTNQEDLQWAQNTLISYKMWNKFSQYHILIDNWIEKINVARGKNFK